ncbi:TraB/GumN family protein [Aridibaculum aurantiacum]|uniref:TraB/GumN family protein n=1 Tax=Aridibaculum aurantiacum TaxID=2810307 RepID=UPI001A9712E6|nr:TraB/GumN family protein [Aridibaculum aurantiacum]
MNIVTVLLSLLGVMYLLSCKQKPSISTAVGDSLLWEVSGNGLKQPSYFLGTMHMMCAEDARLSESTKSIIEYVKHVYLEVDLDNAGELLSAALELTNKSQDELTTVLSASEYDRVRTFFEFHQPQMPFAVLEKQHPLMLASSLYELFLTCEKKNGVELVLVEEASRQNKEIKGLETMAFQASIFHAIPYEEQAKELVKAIDSIPQQKKLMDEMVSIYKQQDINKLYELTTREEAGTAAYTDVLLHDRNKNWVKQFDTIASKHSTLFAVGAGHLGGPMGVVELLRKKGYSLRPLKNN